MSPNKGRTRPAVERIRTLALFLRHGTRFTASEVAERFETTRRTIMRDMVFMRDRLGYDFEYDMCTHRWVLLHAPTPVI